MLGQQLSKNWKQRTVIQAKDHDQSQTNHISQKPFGEHILIIHYYYYYIYVYTKLQEGIWSKRNQM